MTDSKPEKHPGNPANSAGTEFPEFPGLVPAEAMPLSVLARRLAEARYERWIEAGCAGPWIVSSLHKTRPCPRNERPPALSPRWDALKREARERSIRDSAPGLLLEAVRRHDLRVSGIIPPGQRVEIDPLLLPHLAFELEHDRARTADGTICWLALEVAPAARPPRAPNRQRGFIDWYRTAYPDGHPAGKKLEVLAHEAAGALACRISTRTIRRALADYIGAGRGPRTKAAR